MEKIILNENDNKLIKDTFLSLRREILLIKENTYKQINTSLLYHYFHLGLELSNILKEYKNIKYGNKIISELSKKLVNEFGKGYSEYNLRTMIRFYNVYKKWESVTPKLTFTHYVNLIKIKNENERNYYQELAISNNLSIRELKRVISSSQYERRLEFQNNIVNKFNPKELVNDPYILNFLNLKENYNEKELEISLLNELKKFMLECGKGFMFFSEQYHIRIENDNYYPDLIFYNRFTRSFIIMDLKIGKITPQDLGQMQLYVNYFKKYMSIEGENPPIGIVLGSDKNEEVVKLMLNDIDDVFASRYLTYLPKKEELINIIKINKK